MITVNISWDDVDLGMDMRYPKKRRQTYDWIEQQDNQKRTRYCKEEWHRRIVTTSNK